MNDKLTPNPRYLPTSQTDPAFGRPIPADYALDYAPEADTVDLREVIAVLKRNARMILSVAALSAGAVAAFVYTRAPEYEASAIVRLKDMRSAMTAGLGDAGALQGALMGRMTDPLLSELEILHSPAVAEEVINREGLRLDVPYDVLPATVISGIQVDSTFPADTLQATFGESSYSVAGRSGRATAAYGQQVDLNGVHFTVLSQPEIEAAELVVLSWEKALETYLEALQAQPRDQTDVVDVRYLSGDPLVAQRVVNTSVQVFQAMNTEMAQQQSRRRRAFVEEQLVRTDSMLTVAQLGMSEFRRREQVYSTGQQFAAEQTAMMGMELEREALAAERNMYASLLRAVEQSNGTGVDGLRTLISSPAMAQNPIVAQLFARLLQYQTSLDSMTTGRFASSDRNPDVQRLSGLIGSTRTDLVAAARSQVEAVEARIAAMDQMRGRSAGQMQALPATEAEEVRLTLQLETAKEIADQLREEYQKARVAEVVEAGQVEVLALANPPEEPVADFAALKVMLGLMVGLMLGSGGAFLREHMNTTISAKDEMESTLRMPALGLIPQIGSTSPNENTLRQLLSPGSDKRGAGRHEQRLMTAENASSAGAEAYRSLRTNLLFSQVVRELRTLIVTSSVPGEGKTTTAVNLAIAFAQQEMRVLLVDCDLRRPRMHKALSLPLEPGLTQLVLGSSTPEDAIRPTSVPGLFALTSGVLPPNPSELLGSERMRQMMARLAVGFDLVILDTPPVLAAADAAVLASGADGVLMVVRAGKTDRSAAQHAVQQLEAVGARVIGAVLNDPDSKVPQHGGYYGYYEYSGSGSAA